MSKENKDTFIIGITPEKKEKIEILKNRNIFIKAIETALDGRPISSSNTIDCSGIVGGSEFDMMILAQKRCFVSSEDGFNFEDGYLKVKLGNYRRAKKTKTNDAVIRGSGMLSNIEFHISIDKLNNDRLKIFYGFPKIEEKVSRQPTENDYQVLGEIGKFIYDMMQRYGSGIFRGEPDPDDEEKDDLYKVL